MPQPPAGAAHVLSPNRSAARKRRDRKTESLRVSHVLRFKLRTGGKIPARAAELALDGVFQFCPLTFRQSKLSAERDWADNTAVAAASASIKHPRREVAPSTHHYAPPEESRRTNNRTQRRTCRSPEPHEKNAPTDAPAPCCVCRDVGVGRFGTLFRRTWGAAG